MNFDVLVIGSGGAGLISALSAIKEGSTVAVLSKTPVGTASSTAYSSGFFTLPYQDLSFQRYFDNTISVGRGINRKDLVETLGKEACLSLKELQSWGVTVRFLKDGHATVRDSSPIPIVSGGGFISELKTLASNKGVRFIENICVTDILVSNKRVYGVEYCDWMKGTYGRIFCNSLILATGGAGQIFKRTDNPSRITGDGYALALKGGLSLVDMEFIQFYPVGFDEPRFPCWMIRLPIIDIARITDEKGEEFLKAKMQEWSIDSGQDISLYARDRTARLIQEKIAQGHEILLHLEDIEKEKWEEWDLRKITSCFPRGLNPWNYGPVHVSPLEHYFSGGIMIDKGAATSIEGLYACGEVTGGVDGASRVGGNALSNMVSFAMKAGKGAASLAYGVSPKPYRLLEEKKAKKISLSDRGIEPCMIREKIKALDQECLGPLRNEKGIRKVISELEDIYRDIPDLKVEKPQDLLGALEIEGLLLSSLVVAYSACSRKESRGVHYRIDFPLEMQDFERSQFVKIQNGQFVTGFDQTDKEPIFVEKNQRSDLV